VSQIFNELNREVRLGIVLYGGVSLAVYENGVTQELFRAVKGAGIYTILKQITGCDVVLDIISGTSAGGINGILLGYALANDCDPSVGEDFWRQKGDILNLFHGPRDAEPNSILNSIGYYQPQLEEAYTAIRNQRYYPQPGDLVSPINELDVFVTGTNVYGHVYTEFDDFGHAIDVKDHRTVFHLRKRIENDFTKVPAAYAKLSRITSAFPVAFEPVEVNGGSGDPADQALVEWGHLPRAPIGKEGSIFFLDGGILNNKPFSTTLGAIFHHTQIRQVDRSLLYVEPDPERFRTDTKAPAPTSPNVLRSAGDGLSSIPGYQSIAADLASIAAHNSRVQRYRELVSALNRVSDRLMSHNTVTSPVDLAELDRQTPEKMQRSAGANAPEQANLEEQVTVYVASRISRVRDRVIDGVLKQNGQRTLLNEKERNAAESMLRGFNQLNHARALKGLREFDVYYRMRRLFFVADRISEIIYQNSAGADDDLTKVGDEEKKNYRKVWASINQRIKRLEIVQSKMEELIDCADFCWAEIMVNPDGATQIWAGVQSLLRRLLDPSGLPPGVAAAEDDIAQEKLYKVLDERLRRLVASFDPRSIDARADPEIPDNLLLTGDADEFTMLKQHAPSHLQDRVTQYYCRFVFVDSYLFPMQYMSEMECTDAVRTVRISPIDAQLGFSGDSHKRLRGDELWHFGGFLKSAWRANDLMCGRLDGASQLIQCVVTRERLRKGLQRINWAAFSVALRARCPAGANYIPELEKHLENFANSTTDPAKEKERFDNVLDSLVRVGQSQILHDEIPKVIEASIAQQAAWNRYDLPDQIGNPGSASTPRRAGINRLWRGGRRLPDRAVTNYAAIRFTEESTSRDWVKYFNEEYTVSEETWKDGIPKPGLVEIVATMMLVLRQSLRTIAGKRDTALQSRLLKLATLPIWIAYYLTQLQRLAPEYLWNVIVAIAVACVAVLAMSAYARFMLHTHPNLLFWIVPAIALVGLAVVLWVYWHWRFRPSQREKRYNVARFTKAPSYERNA
jgi:patatin-related protein